MPQNSLHERIRNNFPPWLHTPGIELIAVDQSSSSAELSFEFPLEIKVNFLAPSRAEKSIGKGRMVRAGRSIVFLEGEPYNGDGELTATSSSIATVVR